MDVKESLECLDLVKKIAGVVKAAKADGSISFLDAMLLKDLVIPIKLAADGADKIAGELQDLSLAEAIQLVQASVDGVKELSEALMS